MGREGGGVQGGSWPGDGKPRVPSGRLTGAGCGKEGLLRPIERSVPRIRCSGGLRGGRMVLGRGGGVAGGEGGYDCRGSGRLGRGGGGGWGLVWPGDRNPRRPSAGSPELVVGRRRSAGRLWRSVPRICCSGAFGRGKVVLGRSVVRLEGGGVGDCRGSGWLGVGLAGRWESPPACYGRLTGAGPGKEKGIWGSHSGLSPAFAAVGALEGGRWFWGGVVVWLVGKRVMIMAVRAVWEGGWGGLVGRWGGLGFPGSRTL